MGVALASGPLLNNSISITEGVAGAGLAEAAPKNLGADSCTVTLMETSAPGKPQNPPAVVGERAIRRIERASIKKRARGLPGRDASCFFFRAPSGGNPRDVQRFRTGQHVIRGSNNYKYHGPRFRIQL